MHELLLQHYSLHVQLPTINSIYTVNHRSNLAVMFIFSIIADTNGPWKY